MVLKGMIFCCDLLPCGFNGPVCRGYGWSFVRLFLTRQKGRTQHFIWPSNNNNTVDTQPGQLSLMKRTVSPLLIPASHFSFITSSTPPHPPPPPPPHPRLQHKTTNTTTKALTFQAQQGDKSNSLSASMNYLARLSELRRAHHQQTRRAEKKENTNTHNHFVTNPRGSDEVQTSWEGKKSCQPNSLPLHPTQEIRGRSEKRKKKKNAL